MSKCEFFPTDQSQWYKVIQGQIPKMWGPEAKAKDKAKAKVMAKAKAEAMGPRPQLPKGRM